MSALQIEEGKFYKRRDGNVVGPVERRKDCAIGELFMWEMPRSAGGTTCTDRGFFLLSETETNFDLIEEVPNPNAIDNETLTTTFAPVEQIVNGFGDISAVPLGGWSGDEVLVGALQSAGVSVPEENLVLPDATSGLALPTAQLKWMHAQPAPVTRATDLAQTAANLVGGDRDRQHGQKRDNFTRIAAVWNAWLDVRKDKGAPLDAHDVGCMMAMMKLARTQSGKLNLDDYIDAAGYAACAGEVAQS